MRILPCLVFPLAMLASLVVHAQSALPQPLAVAPAAAVNPWLQYLPQPGYGGMSFIPYLMPMQMAPQAQPRPYTMRPVISEEAKRQMMQMMMPMMAYLMRMSMADAMNWAAYKVKAKPGLSFDDVRDSMFLRANQLNFKKVGENLMWKDFQVVLEDKEAPRIEVYSFCDIAVGRDLLKISPEFLVFLPCRISIMEDADKNIWVMMVDWNMDWVAGYESQLGISPELARGARDIRQRMGEIIQAAANGDL